MEEKNIIDFLNKDLKTEFSAVEIYSAHAEAIQEDEIAQGVKAILAVENEHAKDLTLRIEELGGVPARVGEEDTQIGKAVGVTSKQSSTLEMLKLELLGEQQAIRDYSAQIADIIYDNKTIKLLKKNLKDEMDHADWIKSKIVILERKAQ